MLGSILFFEFSFLFSLLARLCLSYLWYWRANSTGFWLWSIGIYWILFTSLFITGGWWSLKSELLVSPPFLFNSLWWECCLLWSLGWWSMFLLGSIVDGTFSCNGTFSYISWSGSFLYLGLLDFGGVGGRAGLDNWFDGLYPPSYELAGGILLLSVSTHYLGSLSYLPLPVS